MGAAALALTTLSATTACSDDNTSSSADGKVTLEFWSWVDDIGKAVDLWNSKNPNIQVHLNSVPGGSQGTYTKMYAAVKAGNAPDVGQIEYAFLPNFAQLGDLVDISSYVTPETKAAFPEWTWTQVSGGKAIYAIPQDIAPMGLFYRKDLFAAAGITAPPATWQEYARDAELVKAKFPNAYITNFPTNQGDWFTGLVWQAGGAWFTQQGDKWGVSINDDASKKVAGYWQDLVDRKLVKAEGFWSDGWNKELQDGTLATWIVGAWGGPNLQKAAPDTSGKWAAAPMPQWTAGANQTGNWGGSTNVVLKGSKHPEQAAKFIQWLNTDPESISMLATASGLYMATSNWTKTDTYHASFDFFGGQKIYETFGAQTLAPTWRWGPTMSDSFTFFQDATGRMESGRGTINDALTQTQDKTVTAMKSAGFPVA
ncbi:ABC transporter substrate-binding protein [Dactylosporangium sucinum]|uniref:Sugar ABC transporter substrate-binding protein n=2 Tax=Dactylosporangium sucinum TaxID=1424081 RepID=A0A917U356_9ACTN|nr:sugar ABC transporter substrate-binding protein [Dactylosporangium sucinum]